MTVYAKIDNGALITAYNGYNGVIGLADSPQLCKSNGFSPYTEDEISGYFAGCYKVIDGVLTDIRGSQEYIQQRNALKKEELQSQIDELEKKQFRSLKAKVKGKNSTADDAKFEEYENQIVALRTEIAGV